MTHHTSRTLGNVTLGLLACFATGALAASHNDPGYYDRGKVVSSTPVYEEINTPRRDCWTERVVSRESAQDRTYGGAVIGGIVGGILGQQVGKGNGRRAATVVGATTGAIVGDRIDNDDGSSRAREVERCRTVDDWSRRVTGYDVVYRYQGHEYSTFLPFDPGPEIKLRVNVSVAE